MTSTAPANLTPKVLTECRGTGVLAVLALVGGRPAIDYPACPGCADCDREAVAARAAALPADPFTLLPATTDESPF